MTKRVIALGFFDGVHIGHGALLTRTREVAARLNIIPSAITFASPPAKAVELINSPEDRVWLIRRLYGVDDVVTLPFDDEVRTMDWERFVEWMASDFGAAHLVAGWDFRFGYMGRGNSELLREKCRRLGLGCDIIPPVTLEGEKVSSTRIRELIAGGKIEKANLLLGHPHFLSGTVLHGRRMGHKLGFPTVNLPIPEGVLAPGFGVYAAKITLSDGRSFPALTNVGIRPTFENSDRITVESHISGFGGDLYGEKIRLDFLEFLRPERKFSSPEELRRQIETDRAALFE